MTPLAAPEPAFGRAGVAAIAGLVLVWEILGRLQLTIFIPSASHVATAWWALVTDGTLFRAAGSSLLSLLKGFVPAAILGVALGLAMGRFRTLRGSSICYSPARRRTRSSAGSSRSRRASCTRTTPIAPCGTASMP